MALLDDLDREAEAFTEALERETYLNGSGQKDDLELAPIYARHTRLFARETIDELRRADPNDERYPELRRLVVEGNLDAAGSELTEAVSDRETHDSVEWDGEHLPCAVAPMVRNEPVAVRRHALEREGLGGLDVTALQRELLADAAP
jgi:hypothetical protein